MRMQQHMGRFARATGLAAALLALSGAAFGEEKAPDWAINSSMRYADKAADRKIVIAAANMRAGVSLERLTLISGEGNMDKKLTAGLLAGATTLLNMKTGSGLGMDFAQREPIAEHMKQEDAEKIAAEALEMLIARLKAAGLEVEGPAAVANAEFYKTISGETTVTTNPESQKGGLFKSGYFYGMYNTPVAGLKYRASSLRSLFGGDTELYGKAREAAKTGTALELNLSFYNNKTVFGIFGLSLSLYGRHANAGSDTLLLTETLKNPHAFTVPSGGKDSYAYWTAIKPQMESVFDSLARNIVEAYKES